MESQKKYTVDGAGNVMRVKLLGDIDHHSAVSVRAEIDREILARRPRRLFLELSEVDFMDSSGLGLIMGRYNTMKEIGGDMVVLDPSAAVKKILLLAGMDRLIRIENTHQTVSPKPATAQRKRSQASKKKKIGKEVIPS